MRPRSTASQLEEFFSLWSAQPRFAIALHTLSEDEAARVVAAAVGLGARAPLPSGAEVEGTAQPRLQGLAVCWDLQQAFFLELSGEGALSLLRAGLPFTPTCGGVSA